MALIRYPGSKERIVSSILGMFPPEFLFSILGAGRRWRYVEPFFGAGAVGFEALKHASAESSVCINDKDPGMVAIWTAVRDHQQELIDRVISHEPTPDQAARDFYRFRDEDGRTDLPVVERAFRKMVLHRTSFSGLGAKAGGPIGGKEQDGKSFNATCRWNPASVASDIRICGGRLRKFDDMSITNLDFQECIASADGDSFIYADPPYVEKGPELYVHSMDEADHIRLRDALRDTEATWVLSYDEHPLVREIYGEIGARIETVSLKYTMATQRGGERRKVGEVIITPKSRNAVVA